MIGKDINFAAALLRKGDVVAIPTETVYGLSGNAFNEDAVKKIFSVKNRPHFNPLIIHTNSINKIKQFVTYFPENAKKLAEKLSPGPITYVLKKSDIVPDIVTGGKDSVAIRIPNHPVTLELLDKLDFPIAAPSANPFGFISPTRAEHVEEQLGEKIPYILDGGKCSVGVESTIIMFEENNLPTILRHGGISAEKIISIIGNVNIKGNEISDSPTAPGQLKSHYAPKHKLIFGNPKHEIDKNKFNPEKIGIISFNHLYENIPLENQIILTKNSELEEAASNLFDSLRKIDKLDLDVILAEEFPDREIGRAINDRLSRAAADRN